MYNIKILVEEMDKDGHEYKVNEVKIFCRDYALVQDPICDNNKIANTSIRIELRGITWYFTNMNDRSSHNGSDSNSRNISE